MIPRNTALCLSSLVLVLLASFIAYAQTPTTGRIAGAVRDQKGAVVAEAEVRVVNKATGDERKTITDATGSYALLLLPPGIYSVRIAAIGFKQAISDNVQVNITQTTIVNAELEVGDLRESVTIRTGPPLIQRDGPQLGRVVDSRAVSELPLASGCHRAHPSIFPTTPPWAATRRTYQSMARARLKTIINSMALMGITSGITTFRASNCQRLRPFRSSKCRPRFMTPASVARAAEIFKH
jgi:carboxypeptidase family protein